MDYNEVDDWQKFRSLHTLPSKAGVSEDNLAKLIAKELTDNALDASHDCSIGKLENGFYVEDYGAGIDGTDNDIASLYSIRRPLRTTKLWRRPTRGALGNGLRVVAGAVCATNGTLTVSTRGRTLRLAPQYEDGSTQSRNLGFYHGPGTRVEVTLPGLPLGDALKWAQKTIWISQGEDYDGHTSPWWYCSDSFRELVTTSRNLTIDEFIRKFCSDFNDPQEGKKVRRLAFEFMKKDLNAFTEADCNDLLLGLRNLFKKPPKPIELLRYRSTLQDGRNYFYREDSGTFTIKPGRGHEARIPFAVQVWAERCDNGYLPSVNFFVNKTHTTADLQVSKVNHPGILGKDDFYCIQGCGLEYLPISKAKAPMNITVGIITSFMPITDEGKEPDLKYVEPVVKNVIKLVAKDAKRGNYTENLQGKSRDTVVAIVKREIDDLINKVSDGFAHRYNPRHLFYPMRDIVNEKLHGGILKWKYFESILTDIENARGNDLPSIYRDLRGTLYHPHLNENIPLGTLNIEKYSRPDWTFNKILYIEKEGFFEILKDLKWPERHDCALLTSKGFATRAARDVIDLLGDTEEEIWFFCTHDADAYGTLIYQSLVEATKARPARKVKVYNLGLEPWEALLKGLRVEDGEKSKGRKGVAEYIRKVSKSSKDGLDQSIDAGVWDDWLKWFEMQKTGLSENEWDKWVKASRIYFAGHNIDWERWLQKYRVELNSMPILDFVEWLDEKIKRCGQGKVVPPDEVIRNEMIERAKRALEKRVREELIKEFDIENLVLQKCDKLLPSAVSNIEAISTIQSDIRRILDQNETQLWQTVANQMVTEIIEKII